MDYIIHLLIIIGIYSIAAISLNFVAGYIGVLVVSHVAFLGIGAYTTALLMIHAGMNFFLAITCAFILSAVIAFFVAIPLLRLKDDSFILVSLGFAYIVNNIMLNWTELTRGPLGISGIPTPLEDKVAFLFLVMVFLAFTYWFFHRIVSSAYGVIMKGIRENDLVAGTLGHNALYHKYECFIVGSAFAAVAGGLLASYLSYIEPSKLFSPMMSIHLFIMVVIGGMGNLRSSILGVSLFWLIPEILRFVGFPTTVMAELQQITFGLILIVIMMYRPQGIAGNYKI